jgi:hypothetical protein
MPLGLSPYPQFSLGLLTHAFPVAVKNATAMLRRFPRDDSRVAAVKFVLLGSVFPKL